METRGDGNFFEMGQFRDQNVNTHLNKKKKPYNFLMKLLIFKGSEFADIIWINQEKVQRTDF